MILSFDVEFNSRKNLKGVKRRGNYFYSFHLVIGPSLVSWLCIQNHYSTQPARWVEIDKPLYLLDIAQIR